MTPESDREFLSLLVGDWELDGCMGAIPLNQAVQARWILANSFVEMRFAQSDYDPGACNTRPPYEALYLLGIDPRSGQFVFHLFDSFGATAEYRYAASERRRNEIEFLFPYPSGDFYNTLRWLPEDESWQWDLEFVQDGGRQPFATKRMRRKSA